MEKEREQQVYLARLAEQAERYDGKLLALVCFLMLILVDFSFWSRNVLCLVILACKMFGQFPI